MSHIGTSPPSGVKRVVHRVDRAVRGGGRRGRPERGVGDAEAHLLALHVAAGLEGARLVIDADAAAGGFAALLGELAHTAAGARTKTMVIAASSAQPCRVSPTMRAERVAERGGDQQDRQEHLEEVRERRRVLERMRRVHVEEAAAVRAELLDRDLRGRRPDGQGLHRAVVGSVTRLARRVEHRAAVVASSSVDGRTVTGSQGAEASATTPCETQDERRARSRAAAGCRACVARQVDPEVADASRPGGARSRGSARRAPPCRSPPTRSSAR